MCGHGVTPDIEADALCQRKAFRFRAQFANRLQYVTRCMLLCPELEFGGFEAKSGAIGCAIHIPDLLGKLAEEVLQDLRPAESPSFSLSIRCGWSTTLDRGRGM